MQHKVDFRRSYDIRHDAYEFYLSMKICHFKMTFIIEIISPVPNFLTSKPLKLMILLQS